jgi:hypothetical protein
MDHLEDSPCLALRLDLTSGDFFRSQVRYKFSTSVCPPPHNHGFSLVISFGRANFPLNIHNVGLAQSACLGDSHDAFRVSHLRDRVFSFQVCSKDIGFMICDLRSYTCKDFNCFFHLWSNGGPNWRREEQIWYMEQDHEWTTVHHKSSRTSGP